MTMKWICNTTPAEHRFANAEEKLYWRYCPTCLGSLSLYVKICNHEEFEGKYAYCPCCAEKLGPLKNE